MALPCHIRPNWCELQNGEARTDAAAAAAAAAAAELSTMFRFDLMILRWDNWINLSLLSNLLIHAMIYEAVGL